MATQVTRPVVKSKGTVSIPDGIYVGKVGGNICSIKSQDFYDTELLLEYGIKGTVMCVVMVCDQIAYCYDRRVEVMFQK